MRRGLLALLVVLVLVVVAGAAAGASPWPRNGYDPGRTGAVPFEGPQTNDTAFQVELPGTPWGEIVVDDGAAYVMTRDFSDLYEGNTVGLHQSAVWRISLATAEVEKVLDLPHDALPTKVLPGTLIYEDGEDLVAVDLPSGEEAWRTRVLPDDEDVEYRFYGEVLKVEDTLYIGFEAAEGPLQAGGDCYFCLDIGGVAAFDLEAQELRWTWRRIDGPGDHIDPQVPGDPREHGSPDVFEPSIESIRLAADDQRVYAYTQVLLRYGIGPYEVERHQYEVWAVEDGQGLLLGNDTEQKREGVYTSMGSVQPTSTPLWSCCARPAITERALYTRLDAFQALNKADGTAIWTSPAGETDQIDVQGASGMGVRGDAYIGTSPQTVYRLDARSARGDLVWMKTDTTPGKQNSIDSAVLDGETAYVSTFHNQSGFAGPGIDARDLATGKLQWTWHHLPDVGFDPEEGIRVHIPAQPAFGPGVAVIGSKDGTVHVIGETEASLGEPDVTASTAYPEVGGEVRVDLSGTEPGAFGNATRYKADWGDGTTTGWQEGPVLTHSYNTSGDQTARFWVGNEASQTSSATQTFHVGEDPPPDPNFAQEAAQTALADGNVDITFGVLGLFVAVTGGAITAGRRYHKRSRLQQELDALEQGFEETRHDPGECEAFLDTRKGRARSLALDGKLNEEQAGIVASRAEELRRDLRRGTVEEQFGFLPYELVMKARTMLEDGEVTELEAEAFLQALEEVETVSDEQRALVRERIEDWFAHDSGGGAG